MGSKREVRRGDESAERLAQGCPRLFSGELATEGLGIVDDLVLPEVTQVVGLFLRRRKEGKGLGVHAGGLAGASLIEKDHAVILQQAVHPPAVKGAETRAGVAGAALEEDCVGRVFLAGTHDLAREDLDTGVVSAQGASVIEGNVKAVLVNGVSVVSVRGRTHGTRVARWGVWRGVPWSRLRAPFRLPLPEYHTKLVRKRRATGCAACLLPQ